MACYKPEDGSTSSAAIDIGYYADGSTFATAPAPASNADGTQIVTAGWANDHYLKLAGGTVTGNLVVNGTTNLKGAVTVPAPTSSNHAARKADVDALTTLTDDGVQVIGSPNYNNLTDPGFYHCNATNAQNGPGYAAKMIVLCPKGEELVTQIAFPIYSTDNKLPAFRNRASDGTTWSEWRPILLSESDEAVKAASLDLTASGMIYYPGNTSASVPNWGFSVNNFKKGDTPDRGISARCYLYDKDSPTMAVGGLAGLLLGVNTNGYTYARLCAFPNISGSSATGNLGVWARPDGTVYTEAPEPEEGDGGTKIATTGWTQKNGGRSWGLGRSAIPMTSTEFSDGDVNKIDKCGFYGLSSAKNALWATSILLHIQRPWTAGPNAFQFNFGTDGEFAVRTFNDATTWSEWRKVAHQDWVLSHPADPPLDRPISALSCARRARVGHMSAERGFVAILQFSPVSSSFSPAQRAQASMWAFQRSMNGRLISRKSLR